MPASEFERWHDDVRLFVVYDDDTDHGGDGARLGHTLLLPRKRRLLVLAIAERVVTRRHSSLVSREETASFSLRHAHGRAACSGQVSYRATVTMSRSQREESARDDTPCV